VGFVTTATYVCSFCGESISSLLESSGFEILIEESDMLTDESCKGFEEVS
jgi:hypothetical protein